MCKLPLLESNLTRQFELMYVQSKSFGRSSSEEFILDNLDKLVEIIYLSKPQTNTYLIFENQLISVDNVNHMGLLQYIQKNRYSMMFYGLVDCEFLNFIEIKYNEIFQ